MNSEDRILNENPLSPKYLNFPMIIQKCDKFYENYSDNWNAFLWPHAEFIYSIKIYRNAP